MLDQEADNLFKLAQRRLTLASQPAQTDIDEADRSTPRFNIPSSQANGRREAQTRNPPSQSPGIEALGAKNAAREVELRDANARGDYAVTHFDLDAMMTVLDAGLNLEFRSIADQRVYRAFVEAELELLANHQGQAAR